MRNERGITLVALVVTIVVLLILAGVTITYALSSDNGLFTKAKETAQVSEQATIRDAVSSAQSEHMMEFYDTSKTTKTTVPDLIKKYVPSGWTVTAATPAPATENGVIKSGKVTVVTGSYTHTVEIENGVVKTISSTAKSN